MIELLPTKIEDLEVLFEFQKDEMSNQMAAFISGNPNDKDAYLEKWEGIVKNVQIPMKTIWLESQIVGSVLCFSFGEETNVSYIIGREYWGKGYATRALAMFLELFANKTFYARTAFDNFGSQRVLEKNGFKKIGTEINFAQARGKEIEEIVFILNSENDGN
jgi:RimJ/RimL family protein N-acetyltransferase